VLGHLALGMQKDSRGRITQIERGHAAEIISSQFRDTLEKERFARAQRFLDEEELDSGIILSRGADLRFWHVTFQEFLVARSLAGLGDEDQRKLLFEEDRLYRAEWREVLLLLAGTLLVKQGRAKVDRLFDAVLDRLGSNPSLLSQACCTGLLGAIVADLRPLKYQPADDRSQTVLSSVMGIFDAQLSERIDLRIRLEAAEALGQAGDPRLKNDNWITILPPDNQTRESMQKEFQIAKYPVTVEEYRRFIGDDGYQTMKFWKDGGFGVRAFPQGWEEQRLHPNRPVVSVTWYEASAYCAWAGVRLLTNAEWELAALGAFERSFPWGSEYPDPTRANFHEVQLRAPTPVGLFPRGATPEGILDMIGNVWEWVADSDGPSNRIVRGCSWYSRSWDLLTSGGSYRADFANDGLGFRCARGTNPLLVESAHSERSSTRWHPSA
jgi:hypothetical protein